MVKQYMIYTQIKEIQLILLIQVQQLRMRIVQKMILIQKKIKVVHQQMIIINLAQQIAQR